MAVLQIRIDEKLKNKAAAIYNELGIDLSTAIRMFLKKSVAIGGIPFETKIDNVTLNAIMAIDNMHTISEENGNSEMTLEDINEEIKFSRQKKK